MAMLVLATLAIPVMAQERVPTGRQEQAQKKQRQELQQAPQRGEIRQVQPRQQVEKSALSQPRAAADSSDAVSHEKVAAWLILGNQAEIELANLALEKSQNEQVREFAQEMVKDHTQFANKLKKFIPGSVAQSDDANRPQREAVAAKHHGGMMELGRKAAELKLSMTKQMLSKYEGQDFDMGYLGQQLIAHTEMIACLTAAQGIGPEEFQQTLGEGLTTTKQHLQHAHQLAAKLENKEYGDGQRREAARPDLRQGDRRDGGARPAIRAEDADAPRVDTPRQGAPQIRPDADKPRGTDGAPKSARDREGITP
jgi:predicted outer membrane protein